MLEVLLTLFLLVLITSLAWPVLDKPMATLRLRRAADEIHAQWASARVEAMDSGRTYMFRYELGGGNGFRVECYSPLETAGDPQLQQSFDPATGGSGYAGSAQEPIQDTLPEGVTFLAGEAMADTRSAMIQTDANTASVTGTQWSAPILFYPDGTTSTAALQLKNQHDRCIQLSLRGLTGMVNIGEVSSFEGQLP